MAKTKDTVLDDKVLSKIASRAIRIFNLEKRIEALKAEQALDLNLLIESTGKDFTLEEVDSLDLETKTIVTKSK